MKTSTAVSYTQKILQVQNHIQKNLDSSMSLEDLAGIATMSPYHFHRVFKELAGKPVKEHIRSLRLEKAAKTLRDKSTPLKQIAQTANYNTVEAFSRAFKNQYDISPAAYRSRSKNQSANGEKQHLPNTNNSRWGSESYSVRVATFFNKRIAYMNLSNSYKGALEKLPEILKWTRKNGVEVQPLDCFVAINDYQTSTAEKIITSCDICLRISDDLQGKSHDNNISTRTLHGGEYAVITHTHGEETIGMAIAWLIEEWLENSDKALDQRPWLIKYRNTIGMLPGDKIVDICMPIK